MPNRATATVERRRVVVDGVALATYVWPADSVPAHGDVVALHGLTANHTCWYPMAAAVTASHRLIAYDLRGRGDSDKLEGGYGLARHAADVLGLLDHFGLSRAVIMGHSLGAAIAIRFAVDHPERVERLVLFDGGLDVRAEVLDSLAPAINRLGIEYPSLAHYLTMLKTLPMFAGRWSEALTRYFTYDVEPTPAGGVRSKVPRHVIEDEVTQLMRSRLWALHHRVVAPTLLLRAPDGLLRADDCLMTAEEAAAMAHAIPRCRLVTVPDSNHYTVLLGDHPLVRREVTAFLRGAAAER